MNCVVQNALTPHDVPNAPVRLREKFAHHGTVRLFDANRKRFRISRATEGGIVRGSRDESLHLLREFM